MKRKEIPSNNKLEKLKEIRRKGLLKLLLDVELGDWINDHIRTAIVKHNYEINKIPKLQVKDFTIKEIKEYESSIE